jgi:nicotinamide-nucleotide amidase
VDAALLEAPGPVSEPVAREMAFGLLRRCRADIAVATTGVAGPAGGEPEAPVGTVWIAWARRGANGEPELIQAARHTFRGARPAVCRQAVDAALDGVLRALA